MGGREKFVQGRSELHAGVRSAAISGWSKAEKGRFGRGIVGELIGVSATIVREGNLSAEGGLAFDILAISCQASPLLLRGIPKPTAALTLARSGTGSEAARKPA